MRQHKQNSWKQGPSLPFSLALQLAHAVLIYSSVSNPSLLLTTLGLVLSDSRKVDRHCCASQIGKYGEG